MKGSKRAKAEVAVKLANPESVNQTEGISQEAYELMVKGKFSCMLVRSKMIFIENIACLY